MKHQALFACALLLLFGAAGCVKSEVVKKDRLAELSEEYESLEKAEANAEALLEAAKDQKEAKKKALAEAKKAEAERLQKEAEAKKAEADQLQAEAEELAPTPKTEPKKIVKDPSLYIDIKIVKFSEDGFELLTGDDAWPSGWEVFFKASKSYFLFVHPDKGKWHFTEPEDFEGPTCYRFLPEAESGQRVTFCP